MFERYTESARRVLFFARLEASEQGGTSILPDHLLLGITREAKGVVCELFAVSHASLKAIRQDVEARAPFGEKLEMSTGIPLSEDAQRVLQFAAEEADRLQQGYVGTEHVLLGLLRQERSTAAQTLVTQGVRLEEARAEIARITAPAAPGISATAAEVVARVEHITQLVGQLAERHVDPVEARQLADRIVFELEALKSRIGP